MLTVSGECHRFVIGDYSVDLKRIEHGRQVGLSSGRKSHRAHAICGIVQEGVLQGTGG